MNKHQLEFDKIFKNLPFVRLQILQNTGHDMVPKPMCEQEMHKP